MEIDEKTDIGTGTTAEEPNVLMTGGLARVKLAFQRPLVVELHVEIPALDRSFCGRFDSRKWN
jgi:hypothetical protein